MVPLSLMANLPPTKNWFAPFINKHFKEPMNTVELVGAAEENGLALMLKGLLEESIAASTSKRLAFQAMRSSFAIAARDAEVQVTLSFDRGLCAIHDGIYAQPALFLDADTDKIPEMSQLKIRFGLPWLMDDAGKNFVRSLVKKQIQIKGIVSGLRHPLRTSQALLDLVRLTQILSVVS